MSCRSLVWVAKEFLTICGPTAVQERLERRERADGPTSVMIGRCEAEFDHFLSAGKICPGPGVAIGPTMGLICPITALAQGAAPEDEFR